MRLNDLLAGECGRVIARAGIGLNACSGDDRDPMASGPRLRMVIGTLVVRDTLTVGERWVASGAMEQVFLRRSVPAIIGSGGPTVSVFPCGDGAAWIPLGQKTLGESGTTF